MNLSIINFTQPVTGNFLVDIIIWLTGISSSIAVGIILFTVLLKLITFPFDFFSRMSMRKNSIKMEEMRPELEKLQKQYANDKNLYNQKMMALYKKNGYSMFGACLPTIITLVIFIVAINAFTSYSQWQNREYFYHMSIAYNEVVYEGIAQDGVYVKMQDGKLVFDHDKILTDGVSGRIDTQSDYDIILDLSTSGKYILTTDGGYTKYECNYTLDENGKVKVSSSAYYLIEGNLINDENNTNPYASAKNNFLKTEDGKYYDGNPANAEAFFKDVRQYMSALKFREEKESFLWVKNIWEKDSPLSHPIIEDWNTFKQTNSYIELNTEGMTDYHYNELIAKLDAEKTQPNGFFILCVLTAGISLVMQLVMSKSQKAQMELQTVDGQGAQTQKIMMWMMPIMMAIFSFMYTSAFSIYMIISSALSIGTTFLINFIADKKYKKKDGDNEKIRGRIHVKSEEELAEEKRLAKEAKKAKKKKKEEPVAPDYITYDENKSKKHVRGRLK